MRQTLAGALSMFFLFVLFVQAQSPEEKILEALVSKERIAELVGDAQPPLPRVPRPDGKQRLYSPDDAARGSAADSVALSGLIVPDELYAVRYLSLANIPANQRQIYAARATFMVNSLSRKVALTIPARVGPDGILLRINLRDYGIDPVQWDKMGDVEPYHYEKVLAQVLRVKTRLKTEKVVKTWPGGIWPGDGKHYAAGTFTYYDDDRTSLEQEKETVSSDKKIGFASWLDPTDRGMLIKLIQSRSPIIRADWFIANASLPPFYYDLLGLKTLDDVKELALFDERARKLFEMRATVVISGQQAREVAENNRILFRIKTALGAWWQTQDYEESIGPKNVINNFLNEKFDGSEIIFSLPNGLQGYFLVDKDNKRVDEVPIKIARDSLAKDKRVRCGRSCIWCHSQGIQPFQSHFKLTVGQKNMVDLGLNDKNDPKKTADLSRKIREVFEDPDFGLIVKADNVRYANAVKAITGTSAPSNAALFLQVYDRYNYVPLSAEDLVYESGVADLDVQAAIAMKVDGVSSGVLGQRLLSIPIRRDHFEENHADFMRRVVAWQAMKRGIKVEQQK